MSRASQPLSRPVYEMDSVAKEEIKREEKVNILVVDDQAENLLVFEGLLEGLNQNLVKASSGKEALKYLLHNDAAVILLDVLMPEMDGFETAKLIRERQKSMNIPIIFVTGINIKETHIFKGYSVGAVDYILKPFSPEILRSKVAVFVDLFKKTEKLKQEINERRKAEQELRKLNETLEQRVAERTAALEQRAQELAKVNAELEQFAYGVSHDLKEPLRMVSNYCGLLEARYKDKLDEKANEFISYAVNGAYRMNQMINDILFFSSLSAKGNPFQSVDSEGVLTEVLNNLRIVLHENGAVVTHDTLPAIIADRTQLVQLFQNLINNAIKFHSEKPPQVHISVKKHDREWLFSIQDNGIGIEDKYLEQVFKIFCKLHGAKSYPGNGIGLATCKKIVERHGGRIWIESKPNKGSTFYFTLKIEEENEHGHDDNDTDRTGKE